MGDAAGLQFQELTGAKPGSRRFCAVNGKGEGVKLPVQK